MTGDPASPPASVGVTEFASKSTGVDALAMWAVHHE